MTTLTATDGAGGDTPVGSQTVGEVENIATLRLLTAPDDQVLVKVLGYYEPGDGGGGDFYWDAESTATDNSGTIIPITGVSTGRWLRIYSGAVKGKWFGAYEDGAHAAEDTAAYQRALALFTNGRTATRSGTIEVDGLVSLNRPLVYGGASGHVLHIRGNAGAGRGGNQTGGTAFVWDGTDFPSMLIFMGANQCIIDGINLAGRTGVGLKQPLHVCTDINVNTTLQAAVTAGASVTATPVSMTNISAGSALGVGNSTNYEVVYVTAVTGSTFTARFQNNHSIGEQVGGSGGSSGVKVRNSHVSVPEGSDSCGILWGNTTGSATGQISEGRIDDVTFTGQGDNGDAYAGMRFISGGNTKNFHCKGGFVNGCTRGISIESGSGAYSFADMTMANNTYADFVQNGGVMHLKGIECEGDGHYFLVGTNGNNLNVCTIESCGFQAPSYTTDDFIIDYNGALTLIGNEFKNLRTETSFAKIKSATLLGDIGPGSIYSVGNFFENATDADAVFYNSGNAIRYGTYAQDNELRIFSFNDFGGEGGALIPFDPMIGAAYMPLASLGRASSVGTLLALGRPSQTYQKVRLSYTDFQTGALTNGLKIFHNSGFTKIVGCYAQTTTPFAGTAGTIELRVGTSSGGTQLILAHDVKSATVNKGFADADLGSGLARASAIQGGIVNGSGIYAYLESSSGNLSGLSAGVVDITVVVERYGP